MGSVFWNLNFCKINSSLHWTILWEKSQAVQSKERVSIDSNFFWPFHKIKWVLSIAYCILSIVYWICSNCYPTWLPLELMITLCLRRRCDMEYLMTGRIFVFRYKEGFRQALCTASFQFLWSVKVFQSCLSISWY